MAGLRPFQIILIGAFAALAIGGLIILAAYRGLGDDGPLAQGVEIWGTLETGAIRSVIASYAQQDDSWDRVSYTRKDPRTFETELTNALAEGVGPDLIVVSSDLLVESRNKITPLSATSLRDYRDTYIDGAEIFLLPDGLYALPLAVDPLVMYWNRDLLASRGIASPPRTWEELVANTVPNVTRRTAAGGILESAIGFGEYSNITNAKGILLMLMLQAGSELVTVDDRGRFFVEITTSDLDVPMPPAEAAIRLYTDFANPARSTYSWNRSLPLDRNMFLAGDLALYFGFGSEAAGLRAGNPNLNFDMAEVPQSVGASLRQNFGTFYGLAIPRGSGNAAGAFEVARNLSSAYASAIIARGADLAPVHRATIAAGSGDAFTASRLRAALVTRGWLDPNHSESDAIFAEMIQSVTSGRLQISQAASDASQRLEHAF